MTKNVIKGESRREGSDDEFIAFSNDTLFVRHPCKI